MASAPSASAVRPAAAAPDAGAHQYTVPKTSDDDHAIEDGSEEENFGDAAVVPLVKTESKDGEGEGFATPVRREHNSNGGSGCGSGKRVDKRAIAPAATPVDDVEKDMAIAEDLKERLDIGNMNDFCHRNIG